MPLAGMSTAGRATRQRLVDLAVVLERLAEMLQIQAGIVPGDIDGDGGGAPE